MLFNILKLYHTKSQSPRNSIVIGRTPLRSGWHGSSQHFNAVMLDLGKLRNLVVAAVVVAVVVVLVVLAVQVIRVVLVVSGTII